MLNHNLDKPEDLRRKLIQLKKDQGKSLELNEGQLTCGQSN